MSLLAQSVSPLSRLKDQVTCPESHSQYRHIWDPNLGPSESKTPDTKSSQETGNLVKENSQWWQKSDKRSRGVAEVREGHR